MTSYFQTCPILNEEDHPREAYGADVMTVSLLNSVEEPIASVYPFTTPMILAQSDHRRYTDILSSGQASIQNKSQSKRTPKDN